MGRVIGAGFEAMRANDQHAAFINHAAAQFEGIGSARARELAEMLRTDPYAASDVVRTQYGGWKSAFDLLREQAGQEALGAAVTGAFGDPAAPGGAAAERSPGEVARALLPLVVKFGLPPSIIQAAIDAYTPQSSVPDWFKQLDPDLYDNFPDVITEAAQSGDYAGAARKLRRRAPQREPEDPLTAESKRLDLEHKRLQARADEIVARGPRNAGEQRFLRDYYRRFPTGPLDDAFPVVYFGEVQAGRSSVAPPPAPAAAPKDRKKALLERYGGR